MFKRRCYCSVPSNSSNVRAKLWKWRLLSLALIVALGVSLGFAAYQLPGVSDDLNGNAPNNPSNILLNSTSANTTWLNFTFTWGPDAQKIVRGEFCLKINICFYTHSGAYGDVEEVIWIIIEANDYEYDAWDYIGLVFDGNQNGYIDTGDKSYGLFANNMTQPSALFLNGFLAFAEVSPGKGPHTVSFKPDIGYTFFVCTPWEAGQALKKGYNPLHVCYHDTSGSGVFVRFSFHIPEE